MLRALSAIWLAMKEDEELELGWKRTKTDGWCLASNEIRKQFYTKLGSRTNLKTHWWYGQNKLLIYINSIICYYRRLSLLVLKFIKSNETEGHHWETLQQLLFKPGQNIFLLCGQPSFFEPYNMNNKFSQGFTDKGYEWGEFWEDSDFFFQFFLLKMISDQCSIS